MILDSLRSFILTFLLVASLCHELSFAEDLLPSHRVFSRAIEDALSYDPQYLVAMRVRESKSPEYDKAKAGLLPNIQFSYSSSRASSELSTLNSGILQPPTLSHYSSESQSLTIRQPLYRPKNWRTFLRSQSVVAGAEYDLSAKLQDVYLRVISGILDVSVALSNVQHAERLIEEAEIVYEQKRQLESAGELTQSDRLVALSELQKLRLDAEDARKSLSIAELSLKNITGSTVRFQFPDNLYVLDFAFELPSIMELLELQQSDNPQLKSKRESVQMAMAEIGVSSADHYPTVDLFASNSKSSNAQDFALGRQVSTSQIGVQLVVPIYSGGQIQATVAQARANLLASEQELRSLELSLRLQLERSLSSVQLLSSRVRILGDQLEVAKELRKVAEDGFIAGEKTSVDVIKSKVRQSAIRRDIISTAADFCKAYLQVWSSVGRLDLGRVEDIERTLFQF